MHHLSRFLLGSLLVMWMSSAAAESDPEPTSPENTLTGLLAAMPSLQAEFSQYAENRDLQTGKFWLEKPNKFRVETGPPLSQTIVSDGANLWTHDKDLEQVVVSLLDANAGEIPVLLFAGDPGKISETFMVESFTDEDSRSFVLFPKADNAILRAIALRFVDDLPVSITIENTMAERTRIELSSVAAGGELKQDVFHFEMPDSVDLIDDRPN